MIPYSFESIAIAVNMNTVAIAPKDEPTVTVSVDSAQDLYLATASSTNTEHSKSALPTRPETTSQWTG